MLVCPHIRLVDGFVGALLPDIKDHDTTVVATGGDQGWALGVEVDAHHSGFSGEQVFGPGWVLDCEAANETASLLQELIGTIRYGEHVLIARVPAHGCNVLPLGLLGGKAPEREDRAEGLRVGIVSVVLVVLVVIENLALGVLDNHTLHDLEAALHGCGVDGLFVLDLDNLSRLLVSLSLGSLLSVLAKLIFVELHE